ncbi:MAG: alpha/beta fold hydrolase [Promethearchaeota archaeon]|jgi:pimeloyl-ACP methyl ester carboxylesterase
MQVNSGFAKVNTTKLYYEILGEGHPLVLIHGGLMDRRMWDHQFNLFAKDYKVIRYDLRGYEKSDVPKDKFSHIDDLYQLLQFLNIDKTYILGLSLGGMIAIDFTLEHPDIVDALITVSSALNGYPYADAEDFESRFLAIYKAAKEEGLDKAIELLMELPFFVPVEHDVRTVQKMRTLIKENFETWSKDQELYVWTSPPAIERLIEIKVPTLVVVGDHDVTDILGVADTLTNEIPGAKKVVIRGAGHHVNMEKPKEFDRIVINFLNNL